VTRRKGALKNSFVCDNDKGMLELTSAAMFDLSLANSLLRQALYLLLNTSLVIVQVENESSVSRLISFK